MGVGETDGKDRSALGGVADSAGEAGGWCRASGGCWDTGMYEAPSYWPAGSVVFD